MSQSKCQRCGCSSHQKRTLRCISTDPAVKQIAKEMLEGFSGYLQTDGYSGYNAVEDVTHVGCRAHVRRKWIDCFVDKKPVDGSKSQKAFEYVEKMFALDLQ